VTFEGRDLLKNGNTGIVTVKFTLFFYI